MTTCPHCGRPCATQHDFDIIAEGEGEHLCWSEWGASCEDMRDDEIARLRAEIARLRAALEAGPAALWVFGDAEMTARTAAVHVEAAQRRAMEGGA